MIDDNQRRQDIAEALEKVRHRIHAAGAAAGRDLEAEPVTLIVVTKTYAAADVVHLIDLGVRDLGENRDQEAAKKRAEVEALRPDVEVTWHCVGQVQTNKARSVATWADVVHSVDRPALIDALAAARARLIDREPLTVLLQVTLEEQSPISAESQQGGGSSTARAGAHPVEIADLAEQVHKHPSLALRGVMAVAPLTADPREAFARLAGVSRSLAAQYPAATWISAGMSGDLEQAIAQGATHVRVGSAILGNRPFVG